MSASFSLGAYALSFQYPKAVSPVLGSSVNLTPGDISSSTISPVAPTVLSSILSTSNVGNVQKNTMTLTYGGLTAQTESVPSVTSQAQSVVYSSGYSGSNSSLPLSVPPNSTQVYSGPQCLLYFSRQQETGDRPTDFVNGVGYDYPMTWQQADDLFSTAATNTIDNTKGIYNCNALTNYAVGNWGTCSGVPCTPDSNTAGSPAYYNYNWFALFANKKDSSGNELAVNSYTLLVLFKQSVLSNVFTISLNAAESSTCASRNAASSNLTNSVPKCWGDNSSGQVREAGNGSYPGFSSLNIATPAAPAPGSTELLPFQLTETYKKVVSGKNHSCGIVGINSSSPEGSVKCWGSNEFGQLGQDPLNPSNPSFPIAYGFFEVKSPAGDSLNALDIVAGDDHTCVKHDQFDVPGITRAYCWGANDKEQLGRAGSSLNPYELGMAFSSIGNIKAIAAGAKHTCVIRDPSNLVYCGGDNSLGQLGEFSLSSGSSAATYGVSIGAVVLDNTNVGTDALRASEISSKGDHTCAIQYAPQNPYCWGKNDKGQLGDGTTVNRDYAVQVVAGIVLDGSGGSTIVSEADDGSSGFFPAAKTVGVGKAHSCVSLFTNSHVYCWGDNSNQQLGINSALTPDTFAIPPAQSSKPMAVKILTTDSTTLAQSIDNFTAVSLVGGLAHTCSVSVYNLTQNVYCWGKNDKGQLGVGSTISQESPVFVNLGF